MIKKINYIIKIYDFISVDNFHSEKLMIKKRSKCQMNI